MNLQNLFKPRGFGLAWKIIIGIVLALLIFQLGMFVGFRKANFAFGWGDNYHRTFGGPQGGLMRGFLGDDFMNGHGVAGRIVKVEDGALVVSGRDNAEILVTCDDDTNIVVGRSKVKLADLKIGENVTVIGSPQSDGSIAAKIIRVFGNGNFNAPPPPGNMRPGVYPAPFGR